MLALRKLTPAPGVALLDIPSPRALLPGEVLVAPEAVGLCGTDLHIADWTGGYEAMATAMPVTLGHEIAGRVIASAAPASAIQVGSRVIVRPSVTCGMCSTCRDGRRDDCTNRRGIGIHRDGGFASSVIVPAGNCIAIPVGMTMDVAALTEPMTICAQAIARSRLEPGMRILILGPGPIGQGLALLAHHAATRSVVVLGRNDAPRLDVVRQLAPVKTIDCADTSIRDALQAAGENSAFDIVFEATGHAGIIVDALGTLAKNGTLVVVGIHARPAAINLTGLVRAEQTITGSYRAPISMWETTIAYLTENAERVRPMITHRVPLDDIMRGFDLARQRTASKVMIIPATDGA